MGLGSRIGMIFTNFIIMIPLFILLIASAIISSIAQSNIADLADQNPSIKNAHNLIRYSTITLWILFAIAILGNAVIGLVASIPYLYAMIMGVFILVNIAVAIVFFYSANAVRNSQDYKDNKEKALTLFKQLIGIGITMVVSAGLLLIYIFWGIHKYRKEGGLTGDIGYISEAGMVVAPEFAPVWTAGQQYSQEQLGERYGDRGEKVRSLISAGQQFDLARKDDSSIVRTIRGNPELMSAALKALA